MKYQGVSPFASLTQQVHAGLTAKYIPSSAWSLLDSAMKDAKERDQEFLQQRAIEMEAEFVEACENVTIIPAGSMVYLRSEYSHDGDEHLFRAVIDINDVELRAQFISETHLSSDDDSIEHNVYIKWLVLKGVVEAVPSFEWCLPNSCKDHPDIDTRGYSLGEDVDAWIIEQNMPSPHLWTEEDHVLYRLWFD
jgi:hypothetical protein